MFSKAYLVPGQPHVLLAPDRNPGWASLKANYEALGREIARSGAELMLLYSTQWFSVIGHLFQTDPKPKWVLVDQNWKRDCLPIPVNTVGPQEMQSALRCITSEH